MKYRIVSEKSDNVGDVYLRLEVKKNFFSLWTQIDSRWALHAYGIERAIAESKDGLIAKAKEHKEFSKRLAKTEVIDV